MVDDVVGRSSQVRGRPSFPYNCVAEHHQKSGAEFNALAGLCRFEPGLCSLQGCAQPGRTATPCPTPKRSNGTLEEPKKPSMRLLSPPARIFNIAHNFRVLLFKVAVGKERDTLCLAGSPTPVAVFVCASRPWKAIRFLLNSSGFHNLEAGRAGGNAPGLSPLRSSRYLVKWGWYLR